MKKYNPQKIEKKWHAIWYKWSQKDAEQTRNTASQSRKGADLTRINAEQTQKNAEMNNGEGKKVPRQSVSIPRQSAFSPRRSAVSEKPKYYVLDMFPYPSGDGLHMGHTESYTASDIIYRYKKLQGFDVLHPQGFDSFGLPAENYAIKTGIHPKETTKKNTENYIKQMKMLGLGHDFNHLIYTSDPSYYKWTQWLFGQFFENGLVERKTDKINWCPSCNTGIANEQVEDGRCERCKTKIQQKEVPGWFFKITDFAEDLIRDLDKVDWPEATKKNQINWIGKSVGSKISFKIKKSSQKDAEQTRNNAESNKDDKLLYKDLTYKIRGAMFNVKKLVGTGHKESVYHKALEIEFKKQGLAFESEKRIDIKYEDEKVGTYQPDFVIEGKVLIELKAVPKIGKQQLNQVWTYLKGSDYKLALLVNYSPSELEIKRLVFDTARNQKNNSSAYSASVPRNFVTSAEVEVFTTRPDTLFGATYLVLAPEHKLVKKLLSEARKEAIPQGGKIGSEANNFDGGGVASRSAGEQIKIINYKEVADYVEKAKNKTEMERLENKIKTGVKLEGVMAVNPANGENIPVFIADYVLDGYGTGAIMAVPAHDERDYEFATRYNESQKNAEQTQKNTENKLIEIKPVIALENKKQKTKLPYTGSGILINSGKFNGMKSEEAKKAITEFVGGEITTNYRLRDWSVSRQRYWGCPIPIVYSPEGEAKFVGEENLPWLLPEDVDFVPTGTAPLAKSQELKERTEKLFGPGWTPEVDTMDTFVDSSWYFLRYPDTENEKEFCSKEKLKKWLPVDLYIGGAEHTYLHLLYARFFVKAMHKIGLLNFDEPFMKLRHQGMVLDENGVKMSKSKGNVVNPNEMVEKFGADATRMYMMFAGPLEEDIAFKEEGVKGVYRFLEKVFSFFERMQNTASQYNEEGKKELLSLLHKTIKGVTEDIEEMKFNTAISKLMIFINTAMRSQNAASQSRTDAKRVQSDVELKEILEKFLILLAPFAPHLAEELFTAMRSQNAASQSRTDVEKNNSIFNQKWPEYNPDMIVEDEIELVVQVNGKLRDKIQVPADISEDDAKAKALASKKIKKHIAGKEIKKIIFVKGRLLNLVI